MNASRAPSSCESYSVFYFQNIRMQLKVRMTISIIGVQIFILEKKRNGQFKLNLYSMIFTFGILIILYESIKLNTFAHFGWLTQLIKVNASILDIDFTKFLIFCECINLIAIFNCTDDFLTIVKMTNL